MKTRKTLSRTVGAAMSAAALAWVAITGGASSGATGGAASDSVALQAVADEGPGYAIEDFGYPDADKILAERHITLKRGDGHIVLADCGSAPDLMWVDSRVDEADSCFKVIGPKGYLALEIPAVYTIKGSNRSTQVDMTVGTETKSFDIRKNAYTPVGESLDPEARDFVLMEIRTGQ